jgi:hypothetical protein
MTLIIPPGFAQVGLAFSTPADPERMFCTFGVDITGIGGDISKLDAKMYASLESTFLNAVSVAYESPGFSIAVGQDGGPPISQYRAWAGGTMGGGVGGACTPQNTAYLIHKVGPGGRRGMGRMYVPGVREDSVDNTGVMNAVLRDAMSVAWGAFLSGMLSTLPDDIPACPLVILHTAGGSAIPPSPISDLRCDARVATQRRRLRP